MVEKQCLICGSDYEVEHYRSITAKYCSRKCQCTAMGLAPRKSRTPEHREKLRASRLSYMVSEEAREKARDRRLGKRFPNGYRGTSINLERRPNRKYLEWIKSVKIRDNDTCRIKNLDCSGRLEVHHILSWREHPELGYDINNGITLCKFHHPRKYSEEIRLVPTFRELLEVKL